MKIIMILGIVLFTIGLLIQMITAKWSWWRGGYYSSNNKPLSFIGWLSIISGLGIVLLVAYLNGQLG